MEIKGRISGKSYPVTITPIREDEWSFLTKKRFSFEWKKLKDNDHVALYLLRIAGTEDVLGVMALIDFPVESRIQIELIAASVENQGHNKEYEEIVGCLIAFTCRLSLAKYGALACISLVPKTRLRKHYMQRYGMLDGGRQVFLDGRELINIIKKYNV